MKDFWEYIVKNKYIIICVGVVVLLYALGIVEFLTKIVILVVLVGLAVFVGKLLQEHEGRLKEIFKFTKHSSFKDNVYYYQNDKNSKKD
ncbi:MAG: hypothetical protein RSB76_01705 [Clostridia bacterium]